MTRIGLVLGAGGVVGQAYHAGVLAALAHDYGWDPRHAELIVGTSAGSITGTLLRAGVPATDLAAWTVRAPLSVEGALLERIFTEEPPELEPFDIRQALRRPRLPPLASVRRAVLRPWQPPGAAFLLTFLAPGTIDIVSLLQPLRDLAAEGWPEGLWLCAVRRRDGRRVVFGRPGSPPAPLHLAVAASCSVPGYFAPVDIGGVSYVDGGVHSPTNAAILAREGLDLVVVVSPMSGGGALPTTLSGLVRRHASMRLRREVRALRRAGTEVVVIEPDREVQEVMGDDPLSSAPASDVVAQAFLSVGRAGPIEALRKATGPTERRAS